MVSPNIQKDAAKRRQTEETAFTSLFTSHTTIPQRPTLNGSLPQQIDSPQNSAAFSQLSASPIEDVDPEENLQEVSLEQRRQWTQEKPNPTHSSPPRRPSTSLLLQQPRQRLSSSVHHEDAVRTALEQAIQAARDEEAEQWQLHLEHERKNWLESCQQRERELQEYYKNWHNELDQQVTRLNEQQKDIQQQQDELRHEKEAWIAEWTRREEQVKELSDQAEEKRKREEDLLQDALSKRQNAMERATLLEQSCEQVQEVLDLKMSEGRQAYEDLLVQLDEKESELLSVKGRIQTFIIEDRNATQAAAERQMLASAQLDETQRRITEEQNKLGTLNESVRIQQERLLELQQLCRDEQAKTERTKQENDLLLASAQQRLEAMNAEMTDRCRKVQDELEQRLQMLQVKEEQLSTLKRDNSQRLADWRQQNEQLSRARAEHESRVREWDRMEERHKEREEASQQQSRKIEFLLRDAQAELHRSQEQLEFARNEQASLHKELLALKRSSKNEKIKWATERSALLEQLEKTQKQLERSATQARQSEEAIQKLHKQRQSADEDRRLMDDLLSKMEENSESLERKLQNVQAERTKLVAIQGEYGVRMAAVEVLERSVSDERDRFMKEKEQLQHSCRRHQLAVLQSVLRQPWREEQEELSAAFSKWVRVALFDNEQEEFESDRQKFHNIIERLQQELQVSQQRRGQEQEMMQEQFKQLEESLKESNRKQAEWNQEEKALRIKMETAHNQAVKLKEENAVLLEKLSKSQQEILLVQKENSMDTAELEQKVRQLECGKDEIVKEKENLQAVRKELEVLRKELENVDAEKQRLVEANALLQQKVSTFDSDNVIQEKRSRAEAMRDDMKVIQYTTKISELENEVIDLRLERDTLKEQLRASTCDFTPSFAGQFQKESNARVADLAASLGERERLLSDRERDSVMQMEATQNRLRLLAEKLREKDQELEKREKQIKFDMEKGELANKKVLELAQTLKQQAADLDRDRQILENRIQSCDSLEKQLNVWQQQLENTIPLKKV
ncbi:hypothetical protein FisN_15Lh007 [Fistulifera solaris]|uniref:Uncharacterized protein n=1 Tax=Fistulifera solaris TaxID=1519565 RepID=A0A1Z5KHX1_FISSO|nr:hypothetical protein FisN_15Lh007 [Fistulifera solaris]|eukprot:GAX25641.1 hypothetical protein FisN_15Lh007 [Fistulifera solaris]